jgi:N-acetylmuramoyl-L-alanine amidase
MGTGIKNGKHHTKHICLLRLILLTNILILFSGFSCLTAQVKTWVVVIDAGHGGRDPGALGSVSREKNINLAIALKTGEYIEQNIKNVNVLYTRKSDVFVGLDERADFANKNKADLFLSIHSNSISKSTIKGTETWIMGPAKDEQNLEVAMKENEVILLEEDFSTKYEGFDPKSPESYIMFTVMQNTYKKQSTWLASNIQSQFKSRAGRIDRGVKQAGFWVLYMTTMPSVIIETGFITNAEEEKYLISKEGQDYLASAIFRACRSYISEIEKKSLISQGPEPVMVQSEDSIPGEKADSTGRISFLVQIASSVKKLEIKAENFKGIEDVREIRTEERYKYAIGDFSNFNDAVAFWRKIRTIVPDAFVIAIRNNKILPLDQAKVLTQEK